jgi:hypothetical protein
MQVISLADYAPVTSWQKERRISGGRFLLITNANAHL